MSGLLLDGLLYEFFLLSSAVCRDKRHLRKKKSVDSGLVSALPLQRCVALQFTVKPLEGSGCVYVLFHGNLIGFLPNQ